jgi:hypothetical protein
MHFFQEFDPFIFPIFFVASWIGIVLLVGRLSGWGRLARLYTTDKSFPDDTKGWQTVAFGMSSYKGCVWVGCDRAGLYLKTGPWILYRLGHPPLFIPWSAVSHAERVKRWWLGFVKFELREPAITFSVRDSAFKDSMRYLTENNLLEHRLD